MTVRVNKSSFNIREKLSELGRKFGLKGSELVAAETVQDARDLVSAGRKNLIINGDMRICQRYGFNNPQTVTNQNDYYRIDGLRENTGGAFQVRQSSPGYFLVCVADQCYNYRYHLFLQVNIFFSIMLKEMMLEQLLAVKSAKDHSLYHSG